MHGNYLYLTDGGGDDVDDDVDNNMYSFLPPLHQINKGIPLIYP